MEIKNPNQNQTQNKNKERQTVSVPEQKEKLSDQKREYTVKKTFQGQISKEEMIRRIVRIFLEMEDN